jgi:hypothetical protein
MQEGEMERRLTRFSVWGYAGLALLLAALSLVMFPAPAEPAALAATTTPTVAASGTPTATPTRGTAQAASGGVKRVTDDFEDPSSGWPQLEFDNYFVGYHEPTYYHVQVSAPGDNVVAPYPKLKFADLSIEATAFADAANTAPQGDFRYGIALRRTGKQFYAFAISPRSQSWYVLKSSATRLEVLAQGKTGPVPGAGGENKLRAEARGPALTFLLDGKVVSQLQDAAYASGEAGFYVETLDAPRVHVHFDTIRIEPVLTAAAAAAASATPPASAAGSCRVISWALNIRRGPGTQFVPDTALVRGALLEPLDRTVDGQWVRVRIPATGQVGWVSRGFIACTVDPNKLPVYVF